MTSHSFKFKKYINEVGFYAMVDLDIDLQTSIVLNIKYDETFVEEEWHAALEFAIKYVYEHYYSWKNEGFSVFVKKLHTMTGDSSQMTVVYALINCLCEALKFNPGKALINLDQKNGTFTMVK